MKKAAVLLFFVLCLASREALAQWTPVSGGMADGDVRSLAIHPDDSKTVYAGTRGFVWRSSDGGASWKRVLSLGSGASSVNHIRISRRDAKTVYAGTDEGLYRSMDGGGHWKRIFQRAEEGEERVRWVELGGGARGMIIVGCAGGLFWSNDGGQNWNRADVFGADGISQVEAQEDGSVTVASNRGLWRCAEDFASCGLIHPVSGHPEESADAEGNAQWDIEGVAPPAAPVYFHSMRSSPGGLLLVNGRKIETTRDGGASWTAAGSKPLSADAAAPPVVMDERAGDAFFVTQKGILLKEGAASEPVPADWGLPTAVVRDLIYDRTGDALWAATDKGIYKLTHPAVIGYFRARRDSPLFDAEIMALFASEPTILELQEAAIRYAEVHPAKVLAWRRAAGLKAWLPTVSLSQSLSQDQNVDIDRGGTGDPDRFIAGPEEDSRDTSLHFSWDLGEIVWNDDQTSIDNRSKLMVQLRDDLLNQLNHLYFARRRLQVEMALVRSEDLGWKIEKELELEEYTAGIDALTGGYLSRKLNEN